MRRFICFCCVLLSLFACSLAEENHPVEILFRGNEWGSSYGEVLHSFPSGTKWRTLEPCNSYPVQSYIWNVNVNTDIYYKENVACWTNMYYSTLDKELIVAGYPVYRINLRFSYVPEGNGLISSSNPRTALIFAEYRFTSSDPNAMFDSLSDKLVALYGNEYKIYNSKSEFGDKKFRIWGGLNETYVSLAIAYNEEVQIRYGFLGGNKLLSDAQKARALEESYADPSDFDGL